jgi:tagaturonate reductase
MKQLAREDVLKTPVRVLQFGEGNFLRAFVDWMINRMNRDAGFNSAVQIVQLLPQGMGDVINSQDGLYHVILRGVKDGKAVESIEKVECVKGAVNACTEWDAVVEAACGKDLRFVFSNTTEAGIEYKEGCDTTFPARVAKLLAERCRRSLPGLIFIPCELIESNGTTLRECILRYLENDEATSRYVREECIFCNTLVDRIVAGYPRDEAAAYCEKIGVEDKLLVAGEPFFFFVIEAPAEVEKELPAAACGIDVVFTADQTPYRTRKVRLLNGAHTASVLAGHMKGLTFVDEMVKDEEFNRYLKQILFEEILPTINLDAEELREYAQAILERFANPYAKHRLLSISLNSVSKWRVRVLPTIIDYEAKFGKIPAGLTASMASLIKFYRTCQINDSEDVKAFFAASPTTDEILSNTDFWGIDLHGINGFAEAVKEALEK